jgi:hypothetical protein
MQDFTLYFLGLLFIRNVIRCREVDHFAKRITVITCAHYNRRHVDFVNVARRLLLDLYSSSYYDVVAIELIALLEERCTCWHLKLVDSNI